MKRYNDFYNFMSEYANMFEDIAKREEEKFKALYSRDTKKIDEILTEQQSIEKKIHEYEQKRIMLHEELGIADKTFREIIDNESGEEKKALEQIFNKLRNSVYNSKHYNKKSLEYAKVNLDIVEEIKAKGISDPHCYNSKGVTNSSPTEKPTFINTKI